MVIRFAKQSDLPHIHNIYKNLFGQSVVETVNYSLSNLEDHFKTFPDGIFVGEYEGQIVGYSMCFLINKRWNDTDCSFLNSNAFVSKWHTNTGITAFGSSLAVLPEFRKYNFAHDLFKTIVLYMGDTYKTIEWVIALCENDNRSRRIHYKLGYYPVYVINEMYKYADGIRDGILMEIAYNDLRKAFTNGTSEKWFGVRNERPKIILEK